MAFYKIKNYMSLWKLEEIVREIISQDNNWTQDPIWCVLGQSKLFFDEEEGEEGEILSYHFTESQAKEFIKKYTYKYHNMEIYVKSWYGNDSYNNTIDAMFEAVWLSKPHRYS